MIRAALVTALLCLGTTLLGAQAPVPALERRVSLNVRDVALRDALDRLALDADIRLSYSGDNLPLDRRVTLRRDTTPLGDVIAALVQPFAVRAVAVAADHVVLAPLVTGSADSARSVQVLDRVVVTGSVIAASERPLPVAIDVVSGRESERRDESSLAEMLSGSVPGVWLWEQTPSTMLARYGSIRGSSSFGLTFPKMYVDGVEVANPLLVTQISPELIERIEVIRGPQGAALYGSDAISGVINIVSRHEGTAPDGSHAHARSSVGASTTKYGSESVMMQEHGVTLRAGSSLRSGGVTLGGSTAGPYVPRAYSREFRGVADARMIWTRSSFTGSARVQAKNAGVPTNPLLAGLDPAVNEGIDTPQRLRMYSLGGTFTYAPDPRWTYTVTTGLDGYRLTNVPSEIGPIPSVADTALQAASGSATRGTLRAAALTHAGSPDRVGATLTVAAEQSVLWDRTLAQLEPGQDIADLHFERRTIGSTGILAQTTLTLRNTAYLTAGIRRELIDQPDLAAQRALLPMAGLSIVRDLRHFSAKGRVAYGKGIRPPHSALPMSTSEPRYTYRNPALRPEEQSGVEAGVDLRIARLVGIHVTRFDQIVTGLIQTVTVAGPSNGNSGSSRPPRYQLQNVGEITNRGWETQATFALGALSLSGAASVVDSRVRKVSSDYTGDMRPGDRMLAVPARTLSATASWTRRDYHLSATVSRASDWVNYDRLEIARALVRDSVDALGLTGAELRNYWTTYPGTTRLRATASRDLFQGFTLNVTGENLLAYQRGEPDTITIVPGRTISLGVKARF